MAVRRKTKDVPIMLCVVLLASLFHISGSVWSGPAGYMPYKAYFFGIVGPPDDVCSRLKGLSRKQMDYCIDHREHIASVLSGANIAREECQFQLKNQRWNCSLSAKDNANVFGRVTKKATRQSAFTFALSSAGVTWAVSRACADGNLSQCGCAKESRNRKKSYNRCGDDSTYGKKFSAMFLDELEPAVRQNSSPRQKARVLMNTHNNNVGRELVSAMTKTTCRCHGTTATCNFKSCWRQLPGFREVGDTLFVKYESAVKVRLNRAQTQLVPRRSQWRRVGKHRSRRKQQMLGDLIYLDESPNYCVRNLKNNVLGTKGRQCYINSRGEDGCDSLCCGRGKTTKIKEVKQRCKCKFVWCCEVKCKMCLKRRVIHNCN